MTDDRDSRLPYPKVHTVSGYRHSVHAEWGAPILLRGSHCDVAEFHGYSATMCVDSLQTVEAGCYGQAAVAYTDHHTCTWSTLYYQTQMWLEWK